MPTAAAFDGNAFTKVFNDAATAHISGSETREIWVCAVPSGSRGSHTLTVTEAGIVFLTTMGVSGVDQTTVYSATANSEDVYPGGAATLSFPLTTTGTDSLLVGFLSEQTPGTTTGQSGTTRYAADSSQSVLTATAASAGSNNLSFISSSGAEYVMCTRLELLAAAGGGGGSVHSPVMRLLHTQGNL